jgi:hypothetical protein
MDSMGLQKGLGDYISQDSPEEKNSRKLKYVERFILWNLLT